MASLRDRPAGPQATAKSAASVATAGDANRLAIR